MLSEKEQGEIKLLLEPYWDDSVAYRSIDVGVGWWPLIVRLHEELAAVDPNYKIIQIKEKFGGLRYYFGSNENDGKTRALVKLYEAKAAVTCSECGVAAKWSEGQLGYIILCATCREKLKKSNYIRAIMRAKK